MIHILGIETSCDDTACSILTDDGVILSNILSSQNEFHAIYGGIVPEIASRKHLELLSPILQIACEKAKCPLSTIDLIAVTNGPGLVGSLLIGVDYAKALSLILEKPFVGVNHLEGHLLSPLIENKDIQFPYLGVIVSGGHTELILVNDFGKYQKVASTLDDACGEALDKFGKLLGIDYPAGYPIEKIAHGGDPKRFAFTMPLIRDNRFALSFSGLKTAGVNLVRGMNPEQLEKNKADLCASYQDILFKQILRMIERVILEYKVTSVAVSGGVSANKTMKEMFQSRISIPVYFPSRILCTDNAAMIAYAGWKKFERSGADPLTLPVVSRLEI